MRDPWISEENALRERMSDPAQVTAADPESELPAYALSFLAHLRLLIGVPFEYLVPDTALLPNESIRFFHLDRSWTDRVVDGVVAVGKIGSREQAHHQAAAPALDALLDSLEPVVRPVQRGLAALVPVDTAPGTTPGSATGPTAAAEPPITGFVLRSALVAGWPHLDMRAYHQSAKLTPIRLERLSTGVMIAMFAGIPDRIEFEEPHHGLQFGVTRTSRGTLAVDARDKTGHVRPGLPVPAALRQTDPGLRVVELDDLRRLLSYRSDLEDPGVPTQSSSAPFAMQLLRPPWKQVFSDEGRSVQPAPLQASIGSSISEPGSGIDIHRLFDDARPPDGQTPDGHEGQDR